MGRQLRRVPLDFDWPVDKVWEGFLNNLPHGSGCPDCRRKNALPHDHGSGMSPFAADLHNKWYGFNGEYDPVADGKTPFTWDHPPLLAYARRQVDNAPDYYGKTTDAKVRANAERLAQHFNAGFSHFLEQEDVDALVEAGRLMDFTHNWTPRQEDGTGGWQLKDPPYRPTAEEVNNWSLSGMGHDSINNWIVIKARCERAGVSSTCTVCDGEGVIWASPEQKAAYEAWEETPPPEGEGWQMWETVTEGSPITPVFATPEELARYLVGNDTSTTNGTTFEQWMKMIVGKGWAPSLLGVAGDVLPGVQGMAVYTNDTDPE